MVALARVEEVGRQSHTLTAFRRNDRIGLFFQYFRHFFRTLLTQKSCVAHRTDRKATTSRQRQQGPSLASLQAREDLFLRVISRVSLPAGSSTFLALIIQRDRQR